MKKRVGSLLISLIAVLAISFLTVNYALPFLNSLFGKRTYSQTNCLTDMITTEMDVYDIAKSYRDGKATVAVTVRGKNTVDGDYYTSLGSGVCVASKGYETSLKNNLVANMGSYIATNYHVIDFFDSQDFSNCTLSIMTDDENTYECELLWFNKDLDVALLYCDGVNINYVKMKDRVVDCAQEDKLDYEPIFAIGTPLELDYLNRLTLGNVASNNPMLFYTGQDIYLKYSAGMLSGYSNYTTSDYATSYEVLSNTYEDVVDITVGITNGNSGGGCFDENGYLIGLTTLGGNVSSTGGNQMNGMVPIYPIMQVLDKLIENNEADGNNTIYSLETLNIFGIDAYEASICSSVKTESFPYYFIDGKFFSSSYNSDFNFADEGYYILINSNTSLKSLTKGCVVKSAQVEGEEIVEITDRNDIVYFLLSLDGGENVTINYQNSNGVAKSIKVSF